MSWRCLRPDRRLRDGRVRPARDHARDHPRRRRHPAPRARGRQAAGDGAGAHRPPLRRRARRSAIGIVNEVTKKHEWLETALELAGRIAARPPIADPARQAGGARRRGDGARRPASSRSGASTSWRWRPRTGSRACRRSSRSASPSSGGDERAPEHLRARASTTAAIATASSTAARGSAARPAPSASGRACSSSSPGRPRSRCTTTSATRSC